jgi:DNA-binding CsgD family transcriptional regulator
MSPIPRPGGDELDLETAARLLAERVEGLGLTPAERAEVLCIALGVPCEASAAVRGVSLDAIRARRRRIRRKLSAALPASRPHAAP